MADERLIARLVESPEWRELQLAAEEAKTQYFTNLAKGIYNDPSRITEADLQYKRGWWRGIDWLLKQPTLDHAKLMRAAETREKDA